MFIKKNLFHASHGETSRYREDLSYNNLMGYDSLRGLGKLMIYVHLIFYFQYFPGGSDVKHLPANVGDPSLIPGSGRFPGGGNGNPLQYSC